MSPQSPLAGYWQTPTTMLELLGHWQQQGRLRPLDVHLARQLATTVNAQPLQLLAVAAVSQHAGRGHVCLPLATLRNDGESLYGVSADTSATTAEPTSSTPTPGELLAAISDEQWRLALQPSALIGDGHTVTPLVWDGQRLYLYRYFISEGVIATTLRQKAQQKWPLTSDLAVQIGRLFPPVPPPQLPWQALAAALACRSALTIISGGPGTGKTTTVLRLLALLQQTALTSNGQPLRMAVCAPTGKAAARLAESFRLGSARLEVSEEVRRQLPTAVSTVHRLLGSRPDSRQFRYHAAAQLPLDLLVVDEASMLDVELMAALVTALPLNARLILLGDKDQLASVEAGAVLGELCADAAAGNYSADLIAEIQPHFGLDLTPFAGTGAALADHIVLLRHSHRFAHDSGIGQLATAINQGDHQQLRRLWQQPPADLHWLVERRPHQLLLPLVHGSEQIAGYADYLQQMAAGPHGSTEAQIERWARAVLDGFNRFRLLCALRRGPWGVEAINQQVSWLLFGEGLISQPEGWYGGRPVMLSHNDYSLGLMNGDVGVTLPLADGLRVAFVDGENRLRLVAPGRLTAVETAYAMTVHKSQGSEFEHAALLLGDGGQGLSRELVYTAVTRAKSHVSLALSGLDQLASAARKPTARASALAERIQSLAPEHG